MKSEKQIRNKLRQVIFRARKKRVAASFKRRSENCKFNKEVRPRNSRQCSRLCMYGVEDTKTWHGVICDDQVDGGTLVRSCQTFEPHVTKEEIREEMEAFLLGKLSQVASRYPDVAALMWVLDSDHDKKALDEWLEDEEPG